MHRVIESSSLDTKSSMTFITLTDAQLDGTPWNPKAQDQLCGRWTAVSEVTTLRLYSRHTCICFHPFTCEAELCVDINDSLRVFLYLCTTAFAARFLLLQVNELEKQESVIRMSVIAGLQLYCYYFVS